MLADGVEAAARTGRVPDQALDLRREIIPSQQIEQVVANVAPHVGHDDRQSVDDRILAAALRAAEYAGTNILAVPVFDDRKGKSRFLARGALRPQPLIGPQ